jgi:hypothetical protein
MSRAAERDRQSVTRKSQEAITTLNEDMYALEPFASEEGLSLEAANTPATSPLSEFDSEAATPPQPDLRTDPAGELLSENLQLSGLADRQVALKIRIKRPASRRRPFEIKRYAAPAGIAAAVAIGLTIIVLGRPPAEIAIKTTSSESTAIGASAFTADHFPLVPAVPAVSPAPPREPSSDSPSSAQANATEPMSAIRLARRDRIVAAEIIPPSGVLAQPAVVAADVPAVSPVLLAATPVVPSAVVPPAAVGRTAALAPVGNLAETDMIQRVLGRYQGAFRALDSVAASAVWPSVDQKALSRAFERLEEQRIEFDKCQIAVEGPRAVASCDGRTRYVPRVGNRSPRTEARQWTFTLLRHEQEWLIDRVESR